MPESIRIEERIVKQVVQLALFYIYIAGNPAHSAFDGFISDPVSTGMGRAGLVMDRPGGFLFNPAISSSRNVAFWWDQPYSLPELGSERLIVSAPVHKSSIGASYGRTGDKGYSEEQFIASGNFAFASDLKGGMSVAWNGLAIDGLPSGNAALINLGVLGQISSDLAAGAVWKNILRASLSGYDDRLPTTIAAGLLLTADDRTKLAFDIEQQPDWPTELRFGISTRVLKALELRGGARANPAEYSAGFTLKHRALQLHYALTWHRDLGASHVTGLDISIR